MNLIYYSQDYDRRYDPSAPVIEVVLQDKKSSKKTEPIFALIDSGSDGCIVPINVLRSIESSRIRRTRMRGVSGISFVVDVHIVTMFIGAIDLGNVRVTADKNGNELIIGRNVLNQLIVTLNGLASVTQIST